MNKKNYVSSVIFGLCLISSVALADIFFYPSPPPINIPIPTPQVRTLFDVLNTLNAQDLIKAQTELLQEQTKLLQQQEAQNSK